MNDNILDSVKQDIGGIESDYHDFDHDIITQINTAFWRLNSLGIGIDDFRLTDENKSSATWADFIGDTTESSLDSIKTYVTDSVRVSFDPPANSFVLTSIEKRMDRYEWLLQAVADKTQK